MGPGVSAWIDSNWLAALGVVVGFWVPFALRPGSPRIRYWTTTYFFSYIGGIENTTLYLRNISDRAITVDQWRSPLTVLCPEGIYEAKLSGVSHSDIDASPQLIDGEPGRVVLNIARFDPGDEVSFDIRHAKRRRAPEVCGEIRGTPNSLVPALTLSQKVTNAPALLANLFFRYISLSSIAWMSELRLNDSGIVRGIIFVLASPLPSLIASPLLRSSEKHAHPARFGCAIYTVGFTQNIFGIVGVILAGLGGYRLWYPQFAIYLILAMLLRRFVSRRPPSAPAIGVVRGGWDDYFALAGPLVELSYLGFAVCVTLGERPGVDIWVGVVAATVYALAGLGPQSAGRLAAMLGNPSRHLSPPSLVQPPHHVIVPQPDSPLMPDGGGSPNEPSELISGSGGEEHEHREQTKGLRRPRLP